LNALYAIFYHCNASLLGRMIFHAGSRMPLVCSLLVNKLLVSVNSARLLSVSSYTLKSDSHFPNIIPNRVSSSRWVLEGDTGTRLPD
jgi:hypothetical protein